MNGKDMLMGLSHIDPKFIFEAEEEQSLPKNRIHHPWKKSLLIAAIISLMLLMLGCVWAILGIQHMTIDAPSFTDFEGNKRHIVSLQGFKGRKSYQAFQEWQTFLDAYDPDLSIMDANPDFTWAELPDDYYSYGCYSWEMVNKAAEICEKYSLEPLGKPWVYYQFEHLFEAVGIKSVFSETAEPLESPFSGYCYNDGTFEIEGDIHLAEPWNYTVGYELRSVQKTSFDTVYSSVGDLDTYDQWEYTMKDGTTVLLALHDGGCIIVDKDDCFVVVNAFGTPEDPFAPIPHDRAFVEAVCESFDFRYQTQRVDPQKAYALQCEEEPHSYEALIKEMLADKEKYSNLQYALIDINGDGQEELFLRSDNAFLYGFLYDRPEIDENMIFTIIGETDGELSYFIGGGAFYLCQGNVIEILSPFEGDEKSHDYYRYDQYFRGELMDQIRPKEGKLYKIIMGDMVEISEEEADTIVAKYPRLPLKFKPAEEFQENH